jgi:hypothetical protein
MMTEEQFAEIHERLTNGEYPQPMVVLRDAQALADEVERLKIDDEPTYKAVQALADMRATQRDDALRDLHRITAEVVAARIALGADVAKPLVDEARRVVVERDKLAEAHNASVETIRRQAEDSTREKNTVARVFALLNDILEARPDEGPCDAARRVVAERDKLAEVHNEQTEQLRMLREEMEASAAAARAELCDVRAERDMLARAVETARTAGPPIDAELGDTEALAIDVFVTGIVTGTDGMDYRLEDITEQTQDFGRPRKAAAEISVRLPSKGDVATERAQWLAARFRRPVVVTFSDAPPGAEGGQ